MIIRVLDFLPLILVHVALMLLTEKKYRKEIADLYFYGALLGLIVARLSYVLLHLNSFSGNILAVVLPTPYNLSLIGGLLSSLALCLIIGYKKAISLDVMMKKFYSAYYLLFGFMNIISYVKIKAFPLNLIKFSVGELMISFVMATLGLISLYIPKKKWLDGVLFVVIMFIIQWL